MKATLLIGAALSLLAIPAFGADLEPAMQFKAAPVPPPFAWTGCYGGAHVGGGWASKAITDPVQLVQDLFSGRSRHDRSDRSTPARPASSAAGKSVAITSSLPPGSSASRVPSRGPAPKRQHERWSAIGSARRSGVCHRRYGFTSQSDRAYWICG